MMHLGLKSTFPRLCNTVVKKRELIIEEVRNICYFYFARLSICCISIYFCMVTVQPSNEQLGIAPVRK